MPYSVINPGAVRDAYSLDLMPTLGVLSQAQQMQQQQLRMNEQLRRQQQAERLQGIGLIGETVNPLEKGTGFSPLDELHARQLGEIKNKATEMVMKGGDPAATYMYLQQATNGLRQRQTDASKLIANAEAVAKAQAAKDPTLDPSLLRQAFLQNAFYQTDDKGARTFNEAFDASSDYTRGILNAGDDVLDPFRNRVAVQQQAAGALPKLFPEQQLPGVPDPRNPLIKYTTKAPGYLTIDPNAKATAYAFEPVEIKRPDGTVMPVPVAKDNIVSALFAAPETGRYLRQEFKDYRQKFPPSVTDADVQRLVATEFLQVHGAKPGEGVTMETKEYELARQNENDQFNRSMAIRRDQRGQAQLSLSVQRFNNQLSKKESDELSTIPGIWRQAKQGNPNAVQILGNNKTVVRVGKLGVSAIDITSMAGQPVFKDPESGREVKLYIGEHPAFGQGLIMEYQRPKMVKVGKKEVQNGWESDGFKIISPNSAATAPPAGVQMVKGDIDAKLTHFFPALTKKRKDDGGEDWEEVFDDGQ